MYIISNTLLYRCILILQCSGILISGLKISKSNVKPKLLASKSEYIPQYSNSEYMSESNRQLPESYDYEDYTEVTPMNPTEYNYPVQNTRNALKLYSNSKGGLVDKLNNYSKTNYSSHTFAGAAKYNKSGPREVGMAVLAFKGKFKSYRIYNSGENKEYSQESPIINHNTSISSGFSTDGSGERVTNASEKSTEEEVSSGELVTNAGEKTTEGGVSIGEGITSISDSTYTSKLNETFSKGDNNTPTVPLGTATPSSSKKPSSSLDNDDITNTTPAIEQSTIKFNEDAFNDDYFETPHATFRVPELPEEIKNFKRFSYESPEDWYQSNRSEDEKQEFEI